MITKEIIDTIKKEYGEVFYLLDLQQFQQNYKEFLSEFKPIYDNVKIAYSYKTNYIPIICKTVDKMGGYAEVVSEMEIEIAYRIGVRPESIIFNGPIKNKCASEKLLLNGGIVNIDNAEEAKFVFDVAKKHPKTNLNVGVRCNFDVGDGVLSRFGVDVDSEEFLFIINKIRNTPNINFKVMHCHYASRKIDYWSNRTKNMLQLIEKLGVSPQIIDLGGGIFGKMAQSLKSQFDCYIPSYKEYAMEIATLFSKHYENCDIRPQLVLEPGSALIGDGMKFVTKVTSIKNIRGKNIATVLGSIYNINPTLNKKNPPITILNQDKASHYEDIDIGGYTCIESDYLFKGYNGDVSVGDTVIFGNIGSYSVVLKPPFILPNFPVVAVDSDNSISLVKRQETFDDLFNTYSF